MQAAPEQPDLVLWCFQNKPRLSFFLNVYLLKAFSIGVTQLLL